jgi:citrate synthase
VEATIARVVSSGERIAGFGHPVYRGIDPRAAHLLEEVYRSVKPHERALLERLAREATRTSTREPNVDFALGGLAFALEMPVGSTEAILAIARTAGWIAHAIEEYAEAPLRFRAKSIYVGEPER